MSVPFATSGDLNLPSDNDSDERMIQTQRQEERDIIVEEFCIDLYSSTQDKKPHVSRLNDLFSILLIYNFQPKESLSVIMMEFLIRLPARSLESSELPSMLNTGYLIPDPLDGEEPSSTRWQNLQVTTYLSCHVIGVLLLLKSKTR